MGNHLSTDPGPGHRIGIPPRQRGQVELDSRDPRPAGESSAGALSSAGPGPDEVRPVVQNADRIAPPTPDPPAPMGRTARTAIGIWILVLSTLALGHLPWAWSLAVRLGNSKSAVHAHWFGLAFTPQQTTILLIIVILTAVIGSAAALGLTFSHRLGYNKLEKGWGWWYVTRPFTAAAIGVLAYALVQAGFFGAGSTSNSDLLAAATIGGLAGLFTDQLLQKMRSALGLSAFVKSASDPTETKQTNATD
jgi:hypothetical protein